MTAQVDLFDRPPEPNRALRPYQQRAVDGVELALASHRSTLLVMATGLGKTVVAAHLAMKSAGRVLFCAHLDTLVTQSLAELQAMTGRAWQREQGPDRASRESGPNVVASIATLMQDRRLTTFAPNAFDRVIVDEAHHYLSPAYLKAISYFKDGGAKIIGLTATPDRKDKKALGKLFDSVAVDPPYDIGFGVDEAWLSPIEWRPIEADVDIDSIPSVAGDLDQGMLDEAIARTIAPILKVAREKVGDRRTIVFTPGVKAAHAVAEHFNKERPGCARSVDGAMDRDLKRATIASHKAGEFQYLINCGVLVEGYDDAQVICMIDAAPTKSRSRCAQKVGRITRPWPGTATSAVLEERQAAIAASPKPHAIWIDLAFNGSKHDIARAPEILGGNYTDAERAKARKALAKDGGGDVREALKRARAQIIAAAERARVRLQERGALNPLKKEKKPEIDPKGPPSPGLVRRLAEFGVPTEGLTHEDAISISRQEFFAQKMGWCGWEVRAKIQQHMGVNAWGMKITAARRLVNNWRAAGRPANPDRRQVQQWMLG